MWNTKCILTPPKKTNRRRWAGLALICPGLCKGPRPQKEVQHGTWRLLSIPEEEIPHLPNFPVPNFEGLPNFWSNPNLSTPNRTQMVDLRFLRCFHSWAGCMGPWHQAESSGHILGFPLNPTLRYLTIPEDTFGLFLPHLFTVDPKIVPVLQNRGYPGCLLTAICTSQSIPLFVQKHNHNMTNYHRSNLQIF